MANDSELFRTWAESRSDTAMGELVQRHLSLVYHTALRRTGGNSTLAKDITQDVFVTAARQARSLANHPMITGWLFTTTRNATAKALRAEGTRRRYEQEAVAHHLTAAEPEKDWDRLRPVIDDALDSLEPSERETILARYFNGQAFNEIGTLIGISPDAARMRTDRALDKLRVALERRGIGSVSAALATVLTTQSASAVPAGVFAGVSAAVTSSAAATAAGIFGFMSATKITAVAAGLVVAVIGTVAVVEHDRAEKAETRLVALTKQQASLESRLVSSEKKLVDAQSRAAEAEKDNGTLLAAVNAARATAAGVPNSKPTKPTPTALPDDPLTHSLQGIFPDGIVAVIGDRKVTVEQVRQELAPLLPKIQQETHDPDELTQRLYGLQNSAIADLVTRQLLIKEFNNTREDEPPKHIAAEALDAAVADRLREAFNNDQAKFAAFIESKGMSEAQYRQAVEEDIIYSFMRSQQRKLPPSKDAKAKASAGP